MKGWFWISRDGKFGSTKATRDGAIADAVGCAICMQRGLKSGAVIEEPDADTIKLIWPGLMRAGWRIESKGR